MSGGDYYARIRFRKRSYAKSTNERCQLLVEIVVPAEGIEPPTFGLQNRCSTAELSRRRLKDAGRAGMGRGCPPVGAAIPDLTGKRQNPKVVATDMNQAALGAA